jgi:hypothetical protein
VYFHKYSFSIKYHLFYLIYSKMLPNLLFTTSIKYPIYSFSSNILCYRQKICMRNFYYRPFLSQYLYVDGSYKKFARYTIGQDHFFLILEKFISVIKISMLKTHSRNFPQKWVKIQIFPMEIFARNENC